MVVGDQGSGDGLAGGAVVPDRRGQGEDALSDPGADTFFVCDHGVYKGLSPTWVTGLDLHFLCSGDRI